MISILGLEVLECRGDARQLVQLLCGDGGVLGLEKLLRRAGNADALPRVVTDNRLE